MMDQPNKGSVIFYQEGGGRAPENWGIRYFS